jgi:hypothetical protein
VFSSKKPSRRAFNMHSRRQPRLNADARLGPIMLKIVDQQVPFKRLTLRSHDSAQSRHVSTSALRQPSLKLIIARIFRNAPLAASNVDHVS